jgi:hypothetical protein
MATDEALFQVPALIDFAATVIWARHASGDHRLDGASRRAVAAQAVLGRSTPSPRFARRDRQRAVAHRRDAFAAGRLPRGAEKRVIAECEHEER